MKIACLTVLLLVVATSSTPTLHKKFYRGIFPGWKVVKGHNRVVGFPYPCIKGYGVLGHLGYLARGIRGDRVNSAIDILHTTAEYRLPGSFDGSINLLIELGRVCGIFVDAIIPGLGQLLSNLVIGLSRVIVCALGSPSFFGINFGDRRPGFGSANDNFLVCQPNYGSRWGWKLFLKGYKNPNLLLDSYGIRHAGVKCDKLIKKHTKGRGIDSLPYAHKLVVLWIRQLCDIADQDYRKYDKNILISLYTYLGSIIGGVGRSCQRGLGLRIAAGLSVYFKLNFENTGITGITDADKTITLNIGKFDQNSFGGVVIPFDGDFVDDESQDDNTDAVVAKDDDDSNDTAVTVTGPTYDGSLKGIARLVTRVLNFKINLVSDVFSLIFRLGFGIGGLIDATISGLGSLLTRIIAVIFKIGVCFNGFPGDRTICNKGWNQQFGVTGEAKDAAELIILFKLQNVQQLIDGHIKTWTKGKGINAASGCMKNILDSCSTLAKSVTNYKTITKDTITLTIVTVTTITASIANADKKDSGKQITQLISKCNAPLIKNGYKEIIPQINQINIIIVKANGDTSVDFNKDTGANKDLDSDDNNGGDTGNNNDNGNNGGNTGNNDNGNNGGNTGNNDNGNNGGNAGNNDNANNGGNTGNNDNGNSGGNTGNNDNGNNGGNTGNNNGQDTGKDTGKGNDNGKDTGKDKDNGKGKDTGKDTGKDKDNGKGKDTGKDTGKDKDNEKGKDTGKDTGKDKDTGKGKDTGKDKDTGKGKDNGKDNGKDTGKDKDSGKGKDTGKDTGKDNNGNNGNNSGNTGGNTGDNNGNTGNNSGDNNGNNGNNGNTGGNTGGDNGNTGGNTGDNNGNTGGNTGNNNGYGDNNGNNNGGNTGNDNNAGGNGKGSGSTNVGGSGSVTVDIGGVIGGVLKGLKGVTKLSATFLTDLTKIKVDSFNAVVKLSVKLCLGLGGVIDTVFIGLGSIFSRLVAVIFKIAICVNNFPGDRGICNKAWNAPLGINGDASTREDILALFRVRKCKTDIQGYIDHISGGKGIQYTPIPIIFQKLLDLCDIVLSPTITKQHVSTCFTSIFTIFGVITNSYQPNSGATIIQKILPVCGKQIKLQGYPDIIVQQQTIITTIGGVKKGNVDWNGNTKYTASGSTDVVKGDGLVTNVKDLLKNVKTDKNIDQTTITAALNIEIPSNFDGVLSFGVKIIQALGSIIDIFISGLGSLLVRIFGCLLRYIVCVSGASRNGNSFVCQKAYFDSFSVPAAGDSWDELVASFKIKTASNDVSVILDGYTKNSGAPQGAVKIFSDQINALLGIFNKGTSISDDDLPGVYRIVTIILGAFGNSCSANLGNQICDNMVPVCNKLLVDNKYKGFEQSGITAIIQGANGVEAPWSKQVTTTVVTN